MIPGEGYGFLSPRSFPPASFPPLLLRSPPPVILARPVAIPAAAGSLFSDPPKKLENLIKPN